MDLVPVETNFLEFNERYAIDRTLSHGACLASVALLLGFPRCYIPSSYTYRELHPWGSHPLTDHLWSSDSVHLTQDTAAAGRVEKTRAVAEIPGILDDLVVCWDSAETNCGKCGKCVRTMVTLKLLGIETAAFPREPSARDIYKVAAGSESDITFLAQNLELAESQRDPSLQRILRKAMRKAALKLAIKEFDHRALDGKIMHAYERWIQRTSPRSANSVGFDP